MSGAHELSTDDAELLQFLRNELGSITQVWTVYTDLYGSSESNLALLRSTDPLAFGLIQRALLGHVVLTICKLNDPISSGHGKHQQENAVFRRLVGQVRLRDEAAAARAEGLLENLSVRFPAFRLLRHKRLAHADLPHAVGEASATGINIARDDIDAALAMLEDCMNECERAFGERISTFNDLGKDRGAASLIQALAIAERESLKELDRLCEQQEMAESSDPYTLQLMQRLARIAMDPAVMCGKPVIRGTRLTVEWLVEKLAHGSAIDELLLDYPSLEREDVLAALAFAARAVRSESPPLTTGDGVPLSDGQKAELDRRLAEYDANPQSAVPWEQLRDELERGE